MWDGKYYKCSGCGEVYCESYSFCPCCKAPCQPLANPTSNASNDESNKYSRSDIVAVEIVKCEKMPTAHLFKIIVSDGEVYLPIVCGAPNCRQGIKTILARVGAKVPHHKTGDLFIVRKGCLRGEFSSGMLLSVRELAYPHGDFSGIVELPSDTQLGTPVDSIWKIKDLNTGQIVIAPWKEYAHEKGFTKVSIENENNRQTHTRESSKQIRSLADKDTAQGAKQKMGIVKRSWKDPANKRIVWVEVNSGQARYRFTYDCSFVVGQQIYLNELRGLERGYGSLWLRKS